MSLLPKSVKREVARQIAELVGVHQGPPETWLVEDIDRALETAKQGVAKSGWSHPDARTYVRAHVDQSVARYVLVRDVNPDALKASVLEDLRRYGDELNDLMGFPLIPF